MIFGSVKKTIFMIRNMEMENKMISDNFKQGNVFLIKAFYQLTGETKIRPVAIVSNEKAIDLDVIVTPITGQDKRNDFDVPIIKWQEAGLEKPSIARTSKLTMINYNNLYKKIGELHKDDLVNILGKCKEVF